MFKVQIDEIEYEVTFIHFPPQHISVTSGLVEPGTLCRITYPKNNRTNRWFQGLTRLHPKDVYNKNIGRKESLKKALQWSLIPDEDELRAKVLREFTKEERTLFWNEYFEVRGKIN